MSDRRTLSAEVSALVNAARGVSRHQRALLKLQVRRNRAYRRLLLSDGELKPEARAVLQDLAAFAGMGVPARALEPLDLAEMEGRKRVVLRLMESLDLTDNQIARIERELARMEEFE